MGIDTKRYKILLEKLEKLAKTLFTIDKPMSRLPYFKNIMGLAACALLAFYSVLFATSFLPDSKISKIITSSFLILILFTFIVISLALTAKRLWDIFDKKVPAIICAFIIWIIVFPLSKLFYIFKILKFIISLVLLLAKGKKRDDNQTTENKEEVSKEG